jgi:hypothetical protein
MTDDFPTRVRTLLAENRRICEFGCNLMERDRTNKQPYPVYVPKTRDGFEGITDEQIERFRKMCAFINEKLPLPTNTNGRQIIGSYGFKHVLEKQKWIDEPNTYVSNGEGIVAMMLCGYEPRWSKDRTNPNCEFSVKKKQYRELVGVYG